MSILLNTAAATATSACPLCGESGRLGEQTDRGWAMGLAGRGRLLACAACGGIHLAPCGDAPEEEYDAEYFEGYPAFHPGSRQNRLRQTLFRRRVRQMARETAGRRLLDIGVGGGDFLLIAREEGWQAEGADITVYARERLAGAGIPLHVGDALDHLAANPEAFDVIHMSHTLEHMPAPRAALLAARAALRPGGVLHVEVPNEFDNLHYRLLEAAGRKRARGSLLGRSLPARKPSPHLFFFNLRSLSALARAAGFTAFTVDARTRGDLIVDDIVKALYDAGRLLNAGPFLTLRATR